MPWPLHPQERTSVPTAEEAAWAPEPLLGFKLQTIQPIASHYADSVILRPTETIAGYKLTMWMVHEGGLKQATSLSWSFVLMTLSGLAHWYQSLITACFYPDIGDCRLLQIAGIYHIFQTLRSTISWKYYIIIIIIYLAFQRSTTVDIELVIR